MNLPSRVLLVAVSVGAVLATAKAHGLQLRLERQLAGYWDVGFGRSNPPWVESLWERERWITWGTGVTVGLLALAYRWLAAARGWPLPVAASTGLSRAWMLLALPAVVAFGTGGAASGIRFAAAGAEAAMPAWVSPELVRAGMWWALAAVLAATSATLAGLTARARTPGVTRRGSR